jgi:uncharacterized protein (TIGR00297 family)
MAVFFTSGGLKFMPAADIIVYSLLLFGAAFTYRTQKLTLAGAITGAIVGLLIYNGAGLTGIAMLAVFFTAGSWATGFKRQRKANINTKEQNHTQRTAGQVLANGGVAALLGALAWAMPNQALSIQLMVAGSFAAATADTLSSELGLIYGRRFYNIISLKKDTRGLDGVVSLEGTLLGLLGAMLIGLTYSIGFGWGAGFWCIVLAGFTGNVADSILGATVERKGWLSNNMVNFLNTAVGAAICWLLSGL